MRDMVRGQKPIRCPLVPGTRARSIAFAVALALVPAPAAKACGAARHAAAARPKDGTARAPLIIGDSTMIFAAPVLGRLGLEANAKGCRQFGEGVAMLAARRHARTLPSIAILALGANGAIGGGQIASTLRIMGPHRILGLVTPRRSGTSETQIRRAARRHGDRVLLIDWVSFSASHGGWFAGDGLHVNQSGATAFARLVRRSVAPFAFPPVRSLNLPRRARGAKRCGVVHRFGRPVRVYVVRGRGRVLCARARVLVRRPPLRPITNWQRYDWRRTSDGPWSWVYARDDRRAVVAAIGGR
jgi:hypothetical protein